uniref:palmitoyl-CoA hydrolase n=1 Tax=Magallana gigas TaxID=29159 RepID=K1PI16_MAGGI
MNMRFTEQAMVIKKLMVITGCFIFCASPYIITTFPVLDYKSPVGKRIHMITAVTLLANSAINPILYVWRFREARYHMKRLLCFWNEKYIEQLQSKHNEENATGLKTAEIISIMGKTRMLWFLFFVGFCAAYKPVVFIHGFNGTPEDGNLIKDIIQKMHPGTLYYTANAFNRTDTVKPLWEEVAIVKPQLVKYMEAHPDGIHLICYSQGGLVCRGLLSTIPDHNVDTLIAVSSPMAGIYGEFKHNFLRIKRMVLIGGPNDGLIRPWQSSLFGFYDENEIVQDMKKQQYFIKDSFGLRTMYEQNRLFMYNIKGIVHKQWVRNPDVIKGVCMKWLN